MVFTQTENYTGAKSDLLGLSSKMTIAYAVASLVLCATIVFSYGVLRNALSQQSHLYELASYASELKLVIRNSAFHMAELKTLEKQQPPGSRLEFKIKAKLSQTHARMMRLRASIAEEITHFDDSDLQLHQNILDLFVREPQSLFNQLDNYSNRIADLVSNVDDPAQGADILWSPVEAAFAIDGSLLRSLKHALSSLQSLVAECANQLSTTHTRLSWFAVFVVLLELVLIFIPLSRSLKNANHRLTKVHDQLYRQANFDLDTGIPNQSGMMEHLAYRDKPMSYRVLLVIRMQESDKIHNLAGPAAMGQVFSDIAKRLQQMFGNDSNVFRTGDEEFSVLVSDESLMDDTAGIKAIQRALAYPMDVGNVQIYPNMALGHDVAPYSPDEVIVRLANARLAALQYDVSQASIPRYEDSMRARIEDENRLAERIREALLNREFIPYYQIKVDANTGVPCGMEALCRWKQADGSMIAPFYFIPVAENSGLIAQLTWQMLEQILEDWTRWRSLGLDSGRIAFNAAQGFLMDTDCCSRFEAMTRVLDQPVCPIDLEITENVALSGACDQVCETLDKFRDMGVPIALDDFGTGFASLNSVVSMDIDIIKVDQSFVQRMTECKDSHTIVRTILNLCKLLDKKSVVEGVETEEQWHACRSLGCDEIQGYHFYKPAPFAEVSQVLMDISTLKKVS